MDLKRQKYKKRVKNKTKIMVKKIARSYVCICVCMVHLGKLGRSKKKNNNKYMRVFLFSFSPISCVVSVQIFVFTYLHIYVDANPILWSLCFSLAIIQKKEKKIYKNTHTLFEKDIS